MSKKLSYITKSRVFHRGIACERGVSPVIGVILMVAITVVLASVLYLWAIKLAEPPQNESMAFVGNINTASDGDWTLNIIAVTGGTPLKISDVEIGVTNPYGIKIIHKDAADSAPAIILNKQKIYLYTEGNASTGINASTDLGKLTNISFVLIDSNGDDLLGGGDIIRIYDDVNNDTAKEVQSGYTFKIFQTGKNAVFEKLLP